MEDWHQEQFAFELGAISKNEDANISTWVTSLFITERVCRHFSMLLTLSLHDSFRCPGRVEILSQRSQLLAFRQMGTRWRANS